MTWWLDPLHEPDELGELDGAWSWSLLDELLLEPDVEPSPEPELPLELEELLWPA